MTLSRRAAACSLAALVVWSASLWPLAAEGRSEGTSAGVVTVTVHYKGQGTVDAGHRIWIWVFDTPDIGPGAMPMREESLSANGASITIDGLGPERVWIAVAFDERGGSVGNAPPASGSPIGIYSTNGQGPTGVATSDGATAVVTFDDSLRMP